MYFFPKRGGTHEPVVGTSELLRITSSLFREPGQEQETSASSFHTLFNTQHAQDDWKQSESSG